MPRAMRTPPVGETAQVAVRGDPAHRRAGRRVCVCGQNSLIWSRPGLPALLRRAASLRLQASYGVGGLRRAVAQIALALPARTLSLRGCEVQADDLLDQLSGNSYLAFCHAQRSGSATADEPGRHHAMSISEPNQRTGTGKHVPVGSVSDVFRPLVPPGFTPST